MNAPVIALDHPAALDAARVGTEGASLAAARAAGLPVVAGVVLTADWTTDDRATAELVWRITSHDGRRPLAMRPSDGARRRHLGAPGHPSTVATTVVVHDVDDLLDAAAAWREGGQGSAPLLLHADTGGAWRGAVFADDRSGRRAAPLVVARAAAGVDDWIASLDDTGRIREPMTTAGVAPSARLLGRLARLAARTTDLLDGPQDLEWMADDEDRLRLVRVRPIVRLRAAASNRVRRHQPCRVGGVERLGPNRPRPAEITADRDRFVA